MNIIPNSNLPEYKDGNRRIKVWFHNYVEGKGIYTKIVIKQASKTFGGGDGYYIPGSDRCLEMHETTEGYVRAAMSKAQQ